MDHLWVENGAFIGLGKLEYFTNLNSSALKGDDFLKPMIPRAWENSEVLITYVDS